jgi:hypothetical protein
MTRWSAYWRMPTTEQLEKMAAERAKREALPAPPSDEAPSPRPPIPIQQRRLSEIPRHVLRVECERCGRTVEIRKTDAVLIYGPHAIWKDVGRKLLDDGCQQRTGRHEEDGCWARYS